MRYIMQTFFRLFNGEIATYNIIFYNFTSTLNYTGLELPQTLRILLIENNVDNEWLLRAVQRYIPNKEVNTYSMLY